MSPPASTRTTAHMTSASEDVSSACSTMSSLPSSTPTSSSSGENHTCPYKDCAKSFSKKYNLKAHLRLHTGEQPFECDRPNCRKKFKWRSSLSSHTVWHTRKDNAVTHSPNRTSKHLNKFPPSSKPAPPLAKAPKPSPKSSLKTATSQTNLRKILVPQHPNSPNPQATSLPSTTNKKKRPRIEMEKSPTPATLAKTKLFKSNVVTQVSVSPNSSAVDLKHTKDCPKPTEKNTAKRHKSEPVDTIYTLGEPSDDVSAIGNVTSLDIAANDMLSPGSPVTSDRSSPEHALGLELFPCGVLPPLTDSRGDSLGFEAADVDTVLGGDDMDIFGLSSPSCGAFNGLDTRFGPFDLDNIQNFCLSKSEEL